MRPLIFRIQLLLCLLAAPGWSVDPVTLHQARYSDFKAGTGEGVALLSEGELALGPVLAPLAEVDGRRVWTLAAEGADLWVGTGYD